MSGILPKQRLTEKQKTQNKFQWAKDTIDTVLEESYPMYGEIYFDSYNQGARSTKYTQYKRKLSNYQLYNNILNQEEFKKECDRFGIVSEDLIDEIKPYNKTYNKINVLLGEELKRPFDYRTAVINEEGVKTKLIEYDMQLENYLLVIMQKITQIAQYWAQQNNENPPQSEEEAQQREERMQSEINRIVTKYMSEEYMEQLQAKNYITSREELANKMLKYFTYALDIPTRKNDNFKHGLLAGEEITWVGVQNGNPVIQEVNPLGFFHSKNGDTKYYEDGVYAGRGTIMSANDIFNNLNDILTDDLVEYLEEHGYGEGVNGKYSDMLNRRTMKHESRSPWDNMLKNRTSYGQHGENYADGFDEFEVYHVEWKAFRKVYFLRFTNEYGDEQMDIVSDDFPIPSYATSEWKYMPGGKRVKVYYFDNTELEEAWIPDVWQGYKIGEEYAGISRKPYQFRSVDNPYKVKLGYHGVSYSNTNAENISLMDRMRPFQFLYFIIAHRLKQFIAEDRAPLVHFDITMVDPKLGLEKTLYYMDQLNIAFFNPLQNAEQAGAYQRGHVSNATDRSTMSHINNYISLLAAIDDEIADVAGVTKQREGASQAYETATANQQAIVQSSHVTESYFYIHSKHWENVLNSLVQIAAECWKDKSIIKQYVLDDYSLETLNITPSDLTNIDIGVFVVNSRRDNEIYNKFQSLAEYALNAQTAKLSDMIQAYKATSSAEIAQILKKAEREQMKLMQQQNEAAQEVEKAKAEAEQQLMDREYEHKKEIEQMKIEAGIREKEIDAFKFQQTLDMDNNNVPDHLEVEKWRDQSRQKDRELDLKEQQMKQDKELKEKEIKTKSATKNN